MTRRELEWESRRVLELIQGLPDAVVGFEAVGTVTVEDYESTLVPAVEHALATHEKIRLLHVLGERLDHHTLGALWDDTRLGLSHIRAIERIAVVSDHDGVRTLVKAGGRSVPGELRLFSDAERGAAAAWVAEGLEASRIASPSDPSNGKRS
jgi:hypothetical protein